MKAEIICIGTELLLGDIVNTNASFLGKELSHIGITLHFVTTVGDNKSRIIDTLKQAFARADVIITSGGLGPTKDDLTHECIADFLGVKLDYHPQIADFLEKIFKALGKNLSKSNLKQAYLPAGAEIFPNPTGTAPGIIYHKDNKLLLTFPGVPAELKNMWFATAKPLLQNKNPVKTIIKSRVLRFFGEGESGIADQVSDLLDQANPTVAPYAKQGEVILRITAQAEDENKADLMIKPVENTILGRLSKFFYGYGETSLPKVVGDLLISKGENMAVADGFTGGLVAQRLGELPESDIFLIYSVFSRELNKYLLIDDRHNESELCLKIAEKIREETGATWGMAITGSKVSDLKEKDTVKINLAIASDDIKKVKTISYPFFRRDNLYFLASQAGLNLLRLKLLKP